MSEELKKLLSAILPTYQYQMPGGMDAAITYQPVYAADTGYEAGKAIQEHYTYRVTVFQRREDPAVIRAVVRALRSAGWSIAQREWMIDPDQRYYQHSIDIDKWEVIT